MVQEKIADSYAQIRMLRLFVLETAWKIDNTSTQETRTDIAVVKYSMAKVLREVSFNALHILGSLGTTDLTPLQAMYAGGTHDGHRGRRRRGPQGHRGPQRPEGLPPPRGLLAHGVLPGQAGAGLGEVRAPLRRRPRAPRTGRGVQGVPGQASMRVVVVGASSGLGRCIGSGSPKRRTGRAAGRAAGPPDDAATEAGRGARHRVRRDRCPTRVRLPSPRPWTVSAASTVLVYAPAVGPLVRVEDMDRREWRECSTPT